MKKTLLPLILVVCALPVLAYDYQTSESVRYYNSQSDSFGRNVDRYGFDRVKVNRSYFDDDPEGEVFLKNPGKPTKKIVIKQSKSTDEADPYADKLKDKAVPMTYEQFPKNYDSSNVMMMHGGGMMPGMF